MRTSKLLEELGQVSHVFSDKTGTLTANLMRFRRLYVHGREYGTGQTEIGAALAASARKSAAAASLVGEAAALAAAPPDEPPTRAPPPPPLAQCKPTTRVFVNYEEAEGSASFWEGLHGGGGGRSAAVVHEDEVVDDDERVYERRELCLAMAINHSVLLETINGEQASLVQVSRKSRASLAQASRKSRAQVSRASLSRKSRAQVSRASLARKSRTQVSRASLSRKSRASLSRKSRASPVPVSCKSRASLQRSPDSTPLNSLPPHPPTHPPHPTPTPLLTPNQVLSASSPDETAFVAAAEHFGFEFVARDAERGLVILLDKTSGERHAVELLEVFPYESSRKRMSVIVRLPPALLALVGGGAAVRLYCKGADSVVFERLGEGTAGSAPEELARLGDALEGWADEALRTLVWAKRPLPQFDEWHRRYVAASSSVLEITRHRAGEPNKITELQAEAEGRLTLQGATAIEDKLQDGVPSTLADLRRAGIKVWMLTGDKVGTAKNIATACNILPSTADVFEITTESFPVLGHLRAAEILETQRRLKSAKGGAAGGKAHTRGIAEGAPHAAEGSSDGAKASKATHAQRLSSAVDQEIATLDALHPQLVQVRAALAGMERQLARGRAGGGGGSRGAKRAGAEAPDDRAGASASLHGGVERRGGSSGGSGGGSSSREVCLVIDERAIEYLSTLCRAQLAAVGFECHSVVGCRARKDQKAELVEIVREHAPDSCCLAIGDGANDVAMLQAGDIGIGIIGKEGMQAVNNSDFAIGQFRFLRSLLFVHGRQNYRRFSVMLYYVFFTNAALVMSMVLYSYLAQASTSPLFVFTYMDLFYLLYVWAPVIVYSFADQDVPREAAAYSPSLYGPGLRREHYTHLKFALNVIETFWLAALVAFIPVIALGFGHSQKVGLAPPRFCPSIPWTRRVEPTCMHPNHPTCMHPQITHASLHPFPPKCTFFPRHPPQRLSARRATAIPRGRSSHSPRCGS